MNNQYRGHRDQHFGCVSYSQHGEDLMLLNLFSLLGIRPNHPLNLTWLDLGAHHPTTISNTKLLSDRGYRGVNVEANPNLIEAFLTERPYDVTINCGVGVKEGLATFYMYDDTSGRNTFSTVEVEALKGKMQVKMQKEVPVLTLNQIVAQYCADQFPPLLTLDIEGLDYEVLATADFSISTPIIVVVETRRDATAHMSLMLRDQGFSPYCRMGENIIAIERNHFLKAF